MRIAGDEGHERFVTKFTFTSLLQLRVGEIYAALWYAMHHCCLTLSYVCASFPTVPVLAWYCRHPTGCTAYRWSHVVRVLSLFCAMHVSVGACVR